MAILGFNSIGSTSGVFIGDGRACKFTPTEDGRIDDLNVYLEHTDGGGDFDSAAVAIYADNSGVPGALLAYATPIMGVPVTPAWYQFTSFTEVVTDGLLFLDGVPIWFALWTDYPTGVRTFGQSGGTNQYSESGTSNSFPTWEDPWDNAALSDNVISIYANYTPDAPPTTTRFPFNYVGGIYLGGLELNAGVTPIVDDFSDSITLSDSITFSIQKSLTDDIGLNDSLDKGILFNITDDISLDDSMSKLIGMGLSDSVSLVDSISKELNISFNDSVNLLDSILKSLDIVFSDDVNLVDSHTENFISLLTFSDSISISDDLVTSFNKLLIDSVSLTDNQTRDLLIQLNDVINLGDGLNKTININISDDITLTDVMVAVIPIPTIKPETNINFIFIKEAITFNHSFVKEDVDIDFTHTKNDVDIDFIFTKENQSINYTFVKTNNNINFE